MRIEDRTFEYSQASLVGIYSAWSMCIYRPTPHEPVTPMAAAPLGGIHWRAHAFEEYASVYPNQEDSIAIVLYELYALSLVERKLTYERVLFTQGWFPFGGAIEREQPPETRQETPVSWIDGCLQILGYADINYKGRCWILLCPSRDESEFMTLEQRASRLWCAARVLKRRVWRNLLIGLDGLGANRDKYG